MVIVQTEVVEKQEAINHAISFGTIGIWIKACHGASASDNAVMLDGNDPASGSLEMIGGALLKSVADVADLSWL